MFLTHRPTPPDLDAFVLTARKATFSYREVGATRDNPPAGYTIDRHRVRIGRGERDFAAASSCLRRWAMFDLGWVSMWPPGAPIEAGTTVAVVAHLPAVWSVNACRIVYVDDEPGWRYRFAYGTLAAHVESGEERFSVVRDREDDSVWYDILAFSRPAHWLARLGSPLSRTLQRRFARGSLTAMTRCTMPTSS